MFPMKRQPPGCRPFWMRATARVTLRVTKVGPRLATETGGGGAWAWNTEGRGPALAAAGALR